MSINYDPDGSPSPDDEAFRAAARAGATMLQVVCDEPDARVGEHVGVSFAAMVYSIPRVGEHIQLEDGGFCKVKRVIHKTGRIGGVIAMQPTVYAVRVPSGAS
jgi:hypothetical protein